MQPLVLQQSLLPLLPCTPLLGQGCPSQASTFPLATVPRTADKDAFGLVLMSPLKQNCSPGPEQRDGAGAAGRWEPPGSELYIKSCIFDSPPSSSYTQALVLWFPPSVRGWGWRGEGVNSGKCKFPFTKGGWCLSPGLSRDLHILVS